MSIYCGVANATEQTGQSTGFAPSVVSAAVNMCTSSCAAAATAAGRPPGGAWAIAGKVGEAGSARGRGGARVRAGKREKRAADYSRFAKGRLLTNGAIGGKQAIWTVQTGPRVVARRRARARVYIYYANLRAAGHYN